MLQLRKLADKSGPEPPRNKAIGVDDEGNPILENPQLEHGAYLESWPFAGVELLAPAPAEHNFADKTVARAMGDGYLTIKKPRPHSSPVPPGVQPYERDPVLTGDEIVILTSSGKLRYRILECPGKYPDESECSGWRVSHEYRCELIES